jgi:hypothetical protein
MSLALFSTCQYMMDTGWLNFSFLRSTSS